MWNAASVCLISMSRGLFLSLSLSLSLYVHCEIATGCWLARVTQCLCIQLLWRQRYCRSCKASCLSHFAICLSVNLLPLLLLPSSSFVVALLYFILARLMTHGNYSGPVSVVVWWSWYVDHVVVRSLYCKHCVTPACAACWDRPCPCMPVGSGRPPVWG